MSATTTRASVPPVGPIPSRHFVLICLAPLAAAAIRTAAPPEMDPYTPVVWLLALVPVFLLTRWWGWRGAGLGLLWSGTAVVLAELFAAYAHGHAAEWALIGTVVAGVASVALGAGLDWQWWVRRTATPGPAAELDSPPPRMGGLPEREVIEFLLVKAFSGARREPPLAVVLIEVDRLDEYARLYGPGVAHKALALLADVLSQHTRSMNIFGRYGAHSCLVLLQGENLEGAHAFATRILEEIEHYPAPWEGRVHLSAGVAGFEPGLPSAEQLVENAARALDVARGMGGSSCVVYVGPETSEPHVPGMMIVRHGGQVKEIHRTL